MLTFAAGNCWHVGWPRPRPTIYTHKVCILEIVQPTNIKLKFKSQKVALYGSKYSKFGTKYLVCFTSFDNIFVYFEVYH